VRAVFLGGVIVDVLDVSTNARLQIRQP
jgi:hypothetical protein